VQLIDDAIHCALGTIVPLLTQPIAIAPKRTSTVLTIARRELLVVYLGLYHLWASPSYMTTNLNKFNFKFVVHYKTISITKSMFLSI